MYRLAFPPCPVEGSTAPVAYGHMASLGAIPEKCTTCSLMFEGHCRRAVQRVERYQVLDYGPCPVEGPTDPVPMTGMVPERTLFVPRKCAGCPSLTADESRGYYCMHDQQTWGRFPRALDWGEWRPVRLPLGLDGKILATEEVLLDIETNRLAQAAKRLRALYPYLRSDMATRCVTMLADKLAQES